MKSRTLHHLSSILICALTMSHTHAVVLRFEFKKLGKQDWYEDKTVILGDVGIIRGNGVQNVQRVCWNSLDTWMTSDIPSEARWRSLNWGVLKLVKPATTR